MVFVCFFVALCCYGLSGYLLLLHLFVTAGSRWRVKQLTYSITKYPSGLRTQDVDLELARAFQVWSDVTELSFVPMKSGKVHIEIRSLLEPTIILQFHQIKIT